MSQVSQLRVFLSYAGMNRRIWEPLERYLQQMYHCQVNWAVRAAAGKPDIESLEDSLVRESDVAIFLLTSHAEGVLRELRLWKQHHKDFQNTVLCVGKDVDRDRALKSLGFELPPGLYLNVDDPWADLHTVLPAVHNLLTSPHIVPERRRRLNEVVQRNAVSIRSKGVPVEQIATFLNRLAARDSYRDWRFRINWPIAEEPPRIDAYSQELDCLQLLESLVESASPIAGHEVEAVFAALERVVQSNERPPRKLSGTILFADTSKNAMDYVQGLVGSHPYETTGRRRATESDASPETLGLPAALLPPSELLGTTANLARYQDVQKRIVQIANQMCKHILCSTYQISISHSMQMGGLPPTSEPTRMLVACTATNTNKEQLAAVADVPVLMCDDAGKIVWYGQPQRYPTSEYGSHWEYHKAASEQGSAKTLIVHFHPIELLELYKRLEEKFGETIPTELFDDGQQASQRGGLEFVVFREYHRPARSAYFGRFLGMQLGQPTGRATRNVVVWKPNHGVWLLADEIQTDVQIVDVLMRIEQVSAHVATELSRELHAR